jgi:hypothetical protein
MIYFGENKMPDFCNRRYPFHYFTALTLFMKMGISLDRVDILAIGKFENYKGEVLAQKPKPGSQIDANTRFVLEVGYPSAIDQMPYQFFYGLQGRLEREGDWEMRTRKLMAPFDAAVVRHEAISRYQMLRFNFGLIDQDYLLRYLDLFDLDPHEGSLDFEEIILWASILPSFHNWAGNPQSVANVLGKIFDLDFKIKENMTSKYDIPTELQYRLGSKSGRLGRESILGQSFVECDSTYEVDIVGISRDAISEFLPGKPKRKKLEWILGISMPSDLDFRITFNVENRLTKIGKKGNGAYLGYSAHV